MPFEELETWRKIGIMIGCAIFLAPMAVLLILFILGGDPGNDGGPFHG